jgi:hypothetical protein
VPRNKQRTSWIAAAALAGACSPATGHTNQVVSAEVVFVAVDGADLYWTECAAAAACAEGTIKHVATADPAATPALIGAGGRLSAQGGTLLWTDAHGRVSRRDPAGAVTTLFEPADATATGSGFTRDATSAYQGLVVAAPAPGWQLWAVPLDGTPPAMLAAEDGGAAPLDLTSDGTDLYFTLAPVDPPTAAGEIRRVPVGGGAAATFASNATRPERLENDAAYVYWTSAATPGGSAPTGQIWRTPKSGGPSVAMALLWGDGALAIDDQALYWAGPAEGQRVTLARIPLDGSDPSTLAAGFGATSTDVTVDAQNAYWTLWGSPAQPDGLLRTVKR